MRASTLVLIMMSTAVTASPAVAAHAAATLCNGEVATIVGTPGADLLTGTPGHDVIAGLGGSDRIAGGNGDDVICGGEGADHLRGDEGADVLLAGKAQWIDNRAGSGYRPDRLDGGPGDDTLDIGREPVERGLAISGVVTFDTAMEGIRMDLAVRTAIGDGRDTVVPRDGLRVVGTAARDVLLGSDLDEELLGGAGADRINGRAGIDRITGDHQGTEESQPGSNDDILVGGPDKDIVTGTLGADNLRGGPGIDVVHASGAGPNRVSGGGSDDFLSIRIGHDEGVYIFGGDQDDHLTLEAPGLVEIRVTKGTIGIDGKEVGRISSIDVVEAAAGVALDFYGGHRTDVVYGAADAPLRAWTKRGDDIVDGSRLDDVIDTGDGNDQVHADAGHDTCLNAERRRSCEVLSP